MVDERIPRRSSIVKVSVAEEELHLSPIKKGGMSEHDYADGTIFRKDSMIPVQEEGSASENESEPGKEEEKLDAQNLGRLEFAPVSGMTRGISNRKGGNEEHDGGMEEPDRESNIEDDNKTRNKDGNDFEEDRDELALELGQEGNVEEPLTLGKFELVEFGELEKLGASAWYWAKPRFFFRAANAIAKKRNQVNIDKYEARFRGLDDKYPQTSQLVPFDTWKDTGLKQLRLCVGEMNRANVLSFMGRFIVTQLLGSFYKGQKITREFFEKYPDTINIRIRKPIIIAGLHRTGSTLLQRLLALDPNARAVHLWKVHCNPNKNTKEQMVRRVGNLNIVSANAFRHMKQLHDMHGDLPEEETLVSYDVLSPLLDSWHYMTPNSTSQALEMFFNDPENRSVGYNYLFRFMQMWSSPHNRLVHDAEKEKHWILKNPYHSLALPALLQVFPDADLVLTHRKIPEVLKSYVQLQCVVIAAKMKKKLYNSRLVALHVLRAQLAMSARLVQFQQLADQGKVRQPLNLRHGDIMKDPVGTVEKIYQTFNRPFTAEYRKILEEYVNNNPPEPSKRKKGFELVGLREEDFRPHESAFQQYYKTFGL